MGSPSRASACRALAGAVCVAAVCIAVAQSPPMPTPLTLAEAVGVALRDNPELNAARARAGAMQERPGQAVALPNPMLTYGAMDAVSGGRWPDTGEKRLMVQQEFPWPGKRVLRRDMAARDAAAMQFEADAMERDIVMRVKETYFDLRATRRAAAIAREELPLLQRLVTVAETMYATGERTQGDVLKAQAEITMLKQKLLDLAAQESTVQARLNTLLNRPADAPAGETITEPANVAEGNFQALVAQAVTNRPEVRAAAARSDRYRLEQSLMAREGNPDYRLGVEYRNLDDGDDMAMLTVSVDLPVWRSRVGAGVREATRMHRAEESAREAAERQVALEVQEAAVRLQSARRTLELYRGELIPQAERRLTASEAGYRTGKTDFMDLLESERFLLNARTMAAMSEGAAGMAVARLERATGTALPAGAATGGPQP